MFVKLHAILVISVTISTCYSSRIYHQFDPSFERHFTKSLKSGDPRQISNSLQELASAARDYFKGKNVRLSELESILLCSACRGGISFFLKTAQATGFDSTAKNVKMLVCPALGLLNVFPKQICEKTIDVFVPEVKYLFENEKLEDKKMCAILLGSSCSAPSSLQDWSINLDVTGEKPPIQIPSFHEAPSQTKKILQITDIHLDLEYTVGSNAHCKDPLCCRSDSGTTADPKSKAGKWGHYNCDLPLWTFKSMLEQIKETNPEGFEYIFLTGDNTAHNIWSQSRAANMNYSATVFDLVKDVFPEQSVFPLVGNHETFPVNSFPPPNINSSTFEPSWLYNGLARLSTSWLSEEGLSTFKVFGHYSELLESGLRVIAINSNVCSNLNFWLNYDNVDLGGQLHWLMEKLLRAEKNNEKVHLLSHIPPGSEECYGAWGREFSRVVNRFENTIVAQFYGHTHVDEFVLFFDEDSRPTNLGFVTPSITTYTEVNPSYRIFTIDGSNSDSLFRIVDYDTYIMDLDKSNEAAESDPIFSKLYSAKNDLELNSLLPNNYYELVQRLVEDDEFYNKYERYVVSNGTLPMERKDVICRLVTTSSSDHKMCDKLTANLK